MLTPALFCNEHEHVEFALNIAEENALAVRINERIAANLRHVNKWRRDGGIICCILKK